MSRVLYSPRGSAQPMKALQESFGKDLWEMSDEDSAASQSKKVQKAKYLKKVAAKERDKVKQEQKREKKQKR